MMSLVDNNFLAHALPALTMFGGVAAAVVMQCGKSRTVKKAGKKGPKSKKSVKGSRKSGKSKRSSKKGGKVSKSSKSKKSSKSGKSKSSKSDKSKKSSQSGKSMKSSKSSIRMQIVAPAKPPSKKSSKCSSKSRSKTSDDGMSKKPTKSVKTARHVVVKNVRKPEVKKSAKVERTQNSIEATKNVRVEPQELRFNQSGGMLKVRVLNPTDHLMAIKVKCSDNNLYRVNPVYSFLQPNDETHIDVVRQNGASKVDKLVLVKAIVSDDKGSPKEAFNQQSQNHSLIVVPLLG